MYLKFSTISIILSKSHPRLKPWKENKREGQMRPSSFLSKFHHQTHPTYRNRTLLLFCSLGKGGKFTFQKKFLLSSVHDSPIRLKWWEHFSILYVMIVCSWERRVYPFPFQFFFVFCSLFLCSMLFDLVSFINFIILFDKYVISLTFLFIPILFKELDDLCMCVCRLAGFYHVYFELFWNNFTYFSLIVLHKTFA